MAFETLLTQARIDTCTSQGYWQHRTICDFLDAAAARTPVKVADLRDQVERCAFGLLALGVESGDVVSFQIPNQIEWVVLHGHDRGGPSRPRWAALLDRSRSLPIEPPRG